MRRVLRLLPEALLLAVLVCTFAAVPAANARSDAPTLHERARGAHLVFTSNRDGDEDVYAADPSGHSVALTRNRAGDGELVVAKNGKWLAVQREYSKLVLISGDGLRERRRDDATPVAFSPNSRLLVFSRGDDDERMYVVAVPRGKPRALGNGYPPVSSLSGRPNEPFSPSGRLLAFSTESDTLGVVDVVTGRRRIVPRSQFREFVGWSPDSRRIALVRSKEKGDGEIETLLVVDVRRPSSPPLELVRGRQGLRAEWLTATKIGFERTPESSTDVEVGVVSATGGSPSIVASGRLFSTVWSPRANRVAYMRRVSEETAEVVLARSDGGASKVVLQGPNLSMQWSPRGRWLAVTTGNGNNDELFVVSADGRRRTRLARGNFGLTESGAWSPDERHLSLGIEDGLGVASVNPPRMRRVWRGKVGCCARWVAGPLPRKGTPAAPAPRPEVAAKRLLRSRGHVFEIASDGSRVVALLGESRVDCDHLVAWSKGTRRVIRFSRPEPCGDYRTYDFGLTLDGTSIRWKNFYCGNDCYVGDCSADVERPLHYSCGEGGVEVPKRPPRPAPPAETRRGVSIVTSGGTIRLRREQDGRTRTIRPPGGAVDAELEDTGLFYAFNFRHRTMPGRIVFVPYTSLFD